MTDAMDTVMNELLFECDGASESWTVQHATFTERINEPFQLVLNVATDDMAAEPARMLGQPATLTVVRGEINRMVMGIVSEIEEGSTDPNKVTASLVVEPAFEALRHRIDTRIFQEKTVPEILEEVLTEDLGDYNRSVELRLERSYPTCDYRTQYNESNLSFCERLMEEEGIVYWFEFDGDAELLVLADKASKFGQIESMHDKTLTFTTFKDETGGHEYVNELTIESEVQPTKLVTRHFDWTAPSTPIEGDSTDTDPGEGDVPNGAYVTPDREVYEHDSKPFTWEPGGLTYANDKDDQLKIRRETQVSEARSGDGRSTVLGMRAAATFEMVGHPRADFDAEYLVLSVTHSFAGRGQAYENQFHCIPAEAPFRRARSTPKPRMPSILSAKVVGPSGEEIHTDEHGRIKVQFHWDRIGANDDHSSCWIRVMQPWAGAGWGFVFIPRIGMEVVVKFINGDPDLPVVVGSVYNGENPPPYSLPDEKTKSTIKTNSSLGGGGFNELRFEDKAGSEEIFTHAQKDYNEVVENDHNTLVHHDQTNTVDNDQTQEIGNDQTEHIGNNQDLTVDANRTTHIKGDFCETVDGSETRLVSSGVNETIDSGEDRTITGGMTETINGDRSQTIVGASTETITGALTQTIVGGAKITTPAAYEITATGGMNITAPGGVTILAPGGHKIISPGGQHTIDNNLTNSGTQEQKFFSTDIGFSIMKLDVVAALAVTYVGISIEATGLKGGVCAASMDNEPTDLTVDGCKQKIQGLMGRIAALRNRL